MKLFKITLFLVLSISPLFSQSEIVNKFHPLNKNQFTADILGDVELHSDQVSLDSLGIDGNVKCDVIWQDLVDGKWIGTNDNLIPVDFDNDGVLELIANSSAFVYPGQHKGFWYILKYNENTLNYEKIYSSELYDNMILGLEVIDQNNDGNLKLLLMSGNTFEVIDLSDFSTIQSTVIDDFDFFFTYEKVAMVYADLDNDGVEEVGLSNNDGLFLINTINWQVDLHIDMPANYFEVGNVDDDPALETVFAHGLTIEINPSGDYVAEYDFLPEVSSGYFQIKLSDLDLDGKEEAVVVHSWYTVSVHDVDSESVKYEIESDGENDGLFLFDLNEDGVDDIIFGANYDDYLNAHNGSNGDFLWSIPWSFNNFFSEITSIKVVDLDSDGELELVWGTYDWSGSPLFVYDLNSLEKEWESNLHIGPFYALEVEDLDQDGDFEIISVSFESADDENGILTIYNAETKEIEFRSDQDLLDGTQYGVYDVEISDYGNDGDLDIIITSKYNFVVVDGDSYTIEAEESIDSDNLYLFEVKDVNSDGLNEIITADDDKLYIINPQDFSIIWTSDVLPAPFNYPKGLEIGNIDDDENVEIVLCKKYIFTFDDDNFTQSQTAENNYSAVKIYDWNSDGKNEIIAGTSDGLVHVLDGESLTILQSFPLGPNEIGSIDFADFDEDGSDDMVAICGNKVFFVTKEGNYVQSQTIHYNLGKYDGLEVVDYDQDGKPNIIIGSVLGVMELDPSCQSCLNYEFGLIGDNLCGEDDTAGIYVSYADSETTFYNQTGNVYFTDSLVDLSPGYYSISAQSTFGCVADTTIFIEEFDFDLEVLTKDKSCFGEDDGSAFIHINQASLPISVEWSNGESLDTLMGLSIGNYDVLVVDNNGCVFEDTFSISQGFLEGIVNVDKLSCIGENDGIASVNINEGTEPFTYFWDTIEGSNSILNLSAGIHSVSILDSNGCSESYEFFVDSTQVEIQAQKITASCNDNDGSISVSILEGSSPFNYTWAHTVDTSSYLTNLSAGVYYVTVHDNNQCSTVDSVYVNESIFITSSNSTDLNCYEDTNGSATIFVLEGTPPYTYQWPDGSSSNSVSNLGVGSYPVTVQDSVGCVDVLNIEINSPDALNVDFTLEVDDESTPQLEGYIEAFVTGGVTPYSYVWDNGIMENSLDDIQNGTYSLLITDYNGCTLDTIIELGIISSIFDTMNDDDINLFPNPNKGIFNLQYNGFLGTIRCKVISSEGKVVLPDFWVDPMDDNMYSFDLPNLSSGFYYLLITSENDSYGARLIISDQ